MSNFYITTTLPYVNAKPHIGHALEFIQADVIVRRRKFQGDQIIFNVWTDEHGLKMFQKAQEAGMDVKDFVDMNAKTFVDFFAQFGIEYTNFYRTSDPSHREVAQGMRGRCMEKWDIYKKSYTGLYCVGCESFKTPKDLIEGKCPDHGVAPVNFEQENYFFRLSNYREPLAKYYRENEVLLPANKLNELLNFVENMEDISISRTKESLPRGVPVPGDEDQVMYVWFDALSNYIGAAGYPHDMQKVADFWPWVQIFWPDNLRFQWAIRQGMLASAGFPFTKTLLMHGMVMGTDGNKMSKTLGNTVDPMDQLVLFGADAVRYYMIAGIPTFWDSAYKPDDLVNMVNSHLADWFGNLLSRVITLANKKEVKLSHDLSLCSEGIKNKLNEFDKTISDYYNNYDLYNAVNSIHELTMFANRYINDIKPRDKETDAEKWIQCLKDLWVVLYALVKYYSPIIPDSSAKAKEMLDTMEKGVLFTKLSL